MNSYIVHRVSKTFLTIRQTRFTPKSKASDTIKDATDDALKVFPKSGHVRPEYLKRLDTIDGRIPHKYEPVYQPKMNRSPSMKNQIQ